MTIFIGSVWTEGVSAKKKFRFQTETDTCERGLRSGDIDGETNVDFTEVCIYPLPPPPPFALSNELLYFVLSLPYINPHIGYYTFILFIFRSLFKMHVQPLDFLIKVVFEKKKLQHVEIKCLKLRLHWLLRALVISLIVSF